LKSWPHGRSNKKRFVCSPTHLPALEKAWCFLYLALMLLQHSLIDALWSDFLFLGLENPDIRSHLFVIRLSIECCALHGTRPVLLRPHSRKRKASYHTIKMLPGQSIRLVSTAMICSSGHICFATLGLAEKCQDSKFVLLHTTAFKGHNKS